MHMDRKLWTFFSKRLNCFILKSGKFSAIFYYACNMFSWTNMSTRLILVILDILSVICETLETELVFIMQIWEPTMNYSFVKWGTSKYPKWLELEIMKVKWT